MKKYRELKPSQSRHRTFTTYQAILTITSILVEKALTYWARWAPIAELLKQSRRKEVIINLHWRTFGTQCFWKEVKVLEKD